MRLRKGDKSTDVALWQSFLNKQGFDYVKADTDFGPATEKATKGFQRICGLPDDGVVGPNTIHQAQLRGFTGFTGAAAVVSTAPTGISIANVGSHALSGMRTYSDKEILSRVATHARGFDGFKDGWYNVWIRSTGDAFDQFDDHCLTYQIKNGIATFKMHRQGTTNAGSYGLFNFRIWNPKGCAVLQSDRMVYDCDAFGYHKHKLNNPCYRQVKGFPYHRDGNRNRRAEEIGPVYTDPIGANDHRVRGFAKWIKNWSVACMVTASEKVYNAWLAMMVKAGKPPITRVILKQF